MDRRQIGFRINGIDYGEDTDRILENGIGYGEDTIGDSLEEKWLIMDYRSRKWKPRLWIL